MIARLTAGALALLSLAAISAAAQENTRKAIAFSYAPEMSLGHCVAADAQSAIACAKKACIANGGTKEDCFDVAACFPANWTVAVFMQHNDGPHWTEFHCGWQSRELALKAAQVACDKTARPELMECAATLLYDEDGKEIEP